MMKNTLVKNRALNIQTGLAAIEFALILPMLLIMAFAVIDFGRVLFEYNTLSKSTRDATRYLASVVRPPAAVYASDATYSAAVSSAQNLALCGSVSACGSNALVDGLTASNISVTYPTSVGGISYVRITIQNYSTSFITNVLGVSKDLGAISVTMRQIQQ